MNTLPELAFHSLQRVGQPGRLRLIETDGRQSEGVTELFATLALRGSFQAIAGGEWIPTYALVQSVRRKTTDVQQVLGRVRLTRPFTCYQVLDLLEDIRPEHDPILILDFLHHFFNPDIQPFVRRRVLEQCCQHLQRLALLRPLIVLVERLHTDEYGQFFPVVAASADEVLRLAEMPPPQDPQLSLFAGTTGG
ncbi:MAG TPA: hypothetical protein VFH29_02070 [Anaerolineales bacterium]|nr:hypothetical protein [Anaerolineales bacterium]